MNNQNSSTYSLLKSFISSGVESGSHKNKYKDQEGNLVERRLDMIAASKHDLQVDSDYNEFKKLGIHTLREGTRWHLIEQSPEKYDFASLDPMLDAAADKDMQIIWNLMHYGWPDDLDLFSPEFVDRFAKYSGETAAHIRKHNIKNNRDEVPIYAPVNEISFMAYFASTETEMFPYAIGRGHEIKQQLVRATIASVDAIRKVDPRARFIHIDPLVHYTDEGNPELTEEAARLNDISFQAQRMIAGMEEPELGGGPEYLDILGFNYYSSNQRRINGEHLMWHLKDPHWKNFSQLLEDAHNRFPKNELFVAESGHVGIGRGDWVNDMGNDIDRVLTKKLPVIGFCYYPGLNRTCWQDHSFYHDCGLFNDKKMSDGSLVRVPDKQAQAELTKAQKIVAKHLATGKEMTGVKDIALSNLALNVDKELISNNPIQPQLQVQQQRLVL